MLSVSEPALSGSSGLHRRALSLFIVPDDGSNYQPHLHLCRVPSFPHRKTMTKHIAATCIKRSSLSNVGLNGLERLFKKTNR